MPEKGKTDNKKCLIYFIFIYQCQIRKLILRAKYKAIFQGHFNARLNLIMLGNEINSLQRQN